MDESFSEDLRKAWQQRLRERQHGDERRRRLAREKACAAASFLRERYGVKKVYLYGSLAWGPSFDQHSDIDLMVEGFAGSSGYWRMLVEVENVTLPFPVSVVLQEDAVEGLRERVQRMGVVL